MRHDDREITAQMREVAARLSDARRHAAYS